MNRASRRATLFHRDIDCALFLDTLSGLPKRFDARVHGYALMPNHYHLMIEVPRGNLSAFMRQLGQVFTQAYNLEHGFDGPLFRGRFKNRLVQNDDYWKHLLAYLHLNPVKGRLVTNPGDCLWTSYNAYVGKRSRPDWLTTEELLRLYGSVDPREFRTLGSEGGRASDRSVYPTSTEPTRHSSSAPSSDRTLSRAR
jgi:putative transposase